MARMAVARPNSISNTSHLHSQQHSINTTSSASHLHHARTASHQVQSLSQIHQISHHGPPNASQVASVSKITASVPIPPNSVAGSNSNQNTPILGASKQLISSSASSSSLKNGISSGSSSSNLATVTAAAAVIAATNSAPTCTSSSTAAAPSPSLPANNPQTSGNVGPNGNGNGGGNASGGPTFNTELRAQMRREREATREKSREKMNGNAHNNNNGGGVGGGGGITTSSGGIGNLPAHQSTHTSTTNLSNHHHHPHSSSQTTLSGRDRSASTVTIGGGNAQVATTASSNSSTTDRKISPKMNTKRPPSVNSNASSSLHNPAQNTNAPQSRDTRHAPQYRSNVSSRNGQTATNSIESRSFPPSKESGSNFGTLDLGSFCENLPSLQGIEDIIARIPSPPRPNQDESSQPLDQSTLFVKQYYALLEKCQSWQRYATNMKARADSFEIENRYLRDTNRKHEEDVRALELQLRGLKETAMILEDERRRNEDRYGRYTQPTLRHPSSQPIRRPSEGLETAINTVPSPPSLMTERDQFHEKDQMSTHRFPSQGSIESGLDLRPPTSLSNLSMPNSLRNAICQNEFGSRTGSYRSYDASEQYYGSYANTGHLDVGPAHNSRQSSHDSNVNDILYQDAQQRDEAAALYEAHQHQLEVNHVFNQVRQRETGISESHSFPPSDVTKSKALTMQSLAAANRERKEAAKMNRLPSSSSAPVLRPSKEASSSDRQFSPPQRILRHQNSESQAGLKADQTMKPSTGSNQSSTDANRNGNVVAQLQGLLRAPKVVDGRLSTVPGSRSGSVQSDTMTITEEYLQGVVEQKRQLRKISLSQQQQLHFLQARVHLSNDATIGSGQTSVSGAGVQDKENVLPSAGLSSISLPGMTGESGRTSRPSSRLSNRGVRGKVRSRAGSHSLHDAIPIDKNDVFSSHSGELGDHQQQDELQQHRALRRTGSAPLGQVNLNGNRSGAMSALEFRHVSGPSDSDVSLDLEEERDRICGVNNESFGATTALSPSKGELSNPENEEAENDPKGAHRRLYMRLRDELSMEELVKFERYVHRYDALDLEMDGPKGIINRVRRLLLSEGILETKFTKRERYQFRKELAREFERIVREDAVPSEVTTENESFIQATNESNQLLQSSQQQNNIYHSPSPPQI